MLSAGGEEGRTEAQRIARRRANLLICCIQSALSASRRHRVTNSSRVDPIGFAGWADIKDDKAFASRIAPEPDGWDSKGPASGRVRLGFVNWFRQLSLIDETH